jgi:hypothetical protein
VDLEKEGGPANFERVPPKNGASDVNETLVDDETTFQDPFLKVSLKTD